MEANAGKSFQMQINLPALASISKLDPVEPLEYETGLFAWDHLTRYIFGPAIWRLWINKQTVSRKSLLLSKPSIFYTEVSRQSGLTKTAAVNFLASKMKQ